MRTLRLTSTVLLTGAVLALTIHTVFAATASAGSPVVVAATPGDSKDPVVAYGNNITHVVWVEGDWIMHSYNTGLAWSMPISTALGDEPSLVVDHDGIPQLAFTELFSSTNNIYHARFISPTWTLPHRISSGSNNTTAPDIAVAPDNSLLLVWSESQPLTLTKQIEIAKSTNSGATWPSVQPVFDAHGNAPKIAIGSDNLTHVVWQDDTATPFHINHVQRSTGAWSVAAIVSSQTTSAFTPELTTLGNKAHIVWKQSNAIQYAYGSDITFSTPVAISSVSGSEPAIATNSSGALIAAWDADTTIIARLGGPGGWGNAQSLGSNGAGVNHVALTSGPNGRVYTVFAAGANGSRDIMFNDYTTFTVYLPLIMR
jgi:hypothetical protein